MADAEAFADVVRGAFDEIVAAGRTIILVTHDPNVAARCEREITLHDGNIASDRINAPSPRVSASAVTS